MKIIPIVALIGIVAAPLAAHATVIIDKTGLVSDISRGYDGEFQFTVGVHNLAGVETAHPYFAGFSPGGPARERLAPTVRYTISFTTPDPLINAATGAGFADWYDLWVPVGDHLEIQGGNDEYYPACGFGSSYCYPLAIHGNTATFQVDSYEYASWSPSEGRQYWAWLTDVSIIGDLPIVRLTDGSTYHLLVFASPVPEPATWLMMIVGFGLAGYRLRRFNRGSVIRCGTAS